MEQVSRNRIMARKWASLKKRGYTPPKSPDESRRRLKEAHHGN